MRTSIIAANWKMNTTLADAHVLASGVRNESEDFEKVEVVLCPPSLWLTELANDRIIPKRLKYLSLGAQNMHPEEDGAFTGELSPLMIKEVAEYVIIGHSERTHLFGEKPDFLNLKVRSALDHGLIPILCIGEDKQEADSGRHLLHMLDYLIRDLNQQELETLVVAYEPVWAIGSGNPATPEYAEQIISTLRTKLTEKTRILYGGSINAANAEPFLKQLNIDGFLIGGASLKLKEFVTICKLAEHQQV